VDQCQPWCHTTFQVEFHPSTVNDYLETAYTAQHHGKVYQKQVTFQTGTGRYHHIINAIK
jgi:hypothetical protein